MYSRGFVHDVTVVGIIVGAQVSWEKLTVILLPFSVRYEILATVCPSLPHGTPNKSKFNQRHD